MTVDDRHTEDANDRGDTGTKENRYICALLENEPQDIYQYQIKTDYDDQQGTVDDSSLYHDLDIHNFI